ncbi:recombinase family protein [Pelosinus sp. sgz500959]|uniref:recombinase family protein n=1 Tax=Pelosinus sp. sgz500959 TaxID=3242472 RepID=UPI00366B2989
MNAIYVRVSTDEQVRKGYSLDDQIHACRNHLLSLGHTTSKEYIDDGYSGEFLERPGLEMLRNDLQNDMIKTVAIYDPDRLSRNLTNQLIIADEIEKAGAKITFVTGDYDCSPEGRLFFSMKGAVSAYEKAKIRERTSRGRRAKATKGKIVLNARPFGYDWDAENSMYQVNEKEAETIRLIYDLCINHGHGSRVIALELVRLGIMGINNRPLSICTVSRILTKKMYYGQHTLFTQSSRKISQNTREIKNNPQELWIPIEIPAIVTRQMWEAAQEQMKLNKKLAKRNTKRDYLLRGILYCTLCGRSMIAYARYSKRKNGIDKIYYYYSCISKESNSYAISGTRCDCRRIPAIDLEDALWKILVEIASGTKYLDTYLRIKNRPDYSKEIERLTKLHLELKKKQADITRWYRESIIDGETAEKELQSVNKELVATLSTLSDLNVAQEKLKQLAISPAAILDAKTFEEKRDVLIKLPYKIHAVRLNENFEFCFTR